MFADVYKPTYLSPEEIDDYLAEGWFRAGRTLFTTHFLHFDDVLYSAIWLRILLADFELTKSQRKKLQSVSRFTFEIQPFVLTDEKEQLYTDYKSGITFRTATSLNQLLLDNQSFSPFDTYEVAVYDDEKLVGLGVFDMGKDTAAGIVSFAHPDYKRYSLGKVIILEKILYTQQIGFRYFYPGYFAPGYPVFDYKLSFGKDSTEFYDVHARQWKSSQGFGEANDSIKCLYEKLQKARAELQLKSIKAALLIYDYYELNLTYQFSGQRLLDVPVFLLTYESNGFQSEIITYNLSKNQYELIRCDVVYYMPNSSPKTGHYNHRILRPRTLLFTASSVTDLLKTPRLHS